MSRFPAITVFMAFPSEAAPQPSLDDIERSSYPTVEREDDGIGYVIVDLR